MSNTDLLVEVDGDEVTVSALPSRGEAFQAAATKLLASGDVTTVTGARGVALRVSRSVAEKAGVVDKPKTRKTRATTTTEKDEK